MKEFKVTERKGNNQEFKVPEELKSGTHIRDVLIDRIQNSPFSKMRRKEKMIKIDTDNLHLKRGKKSICGNRVLSICNFSWFL